MKKITIVALVAAITICSTQHDVHAMDRVAALLHNARHDLNQLLQPAQPIAQQPVQQAVVHQAPVQPSKWQRFKNAAAAKLTTVKNVITNRIAGLRHQAHQQVVPLSRWQRFKNFTVAQINRAAGALRLRQPRPAVVQQPVAIQQPVAVQPGRWQHFKNAATTKLIAAKNIAANGSRALLSALRNHPRLTALGISAAVMYLTYRILYLQEPCEIQCMYDYYIPPVSNADLKQRLLNCYQQCYSSQHGMLGKLIDQFVR